MSLKEKLTAALEAKENDVNSFVWKFSKKDNKADIKLMDATPEQLREFRNHCISMLTSKDKRSPGRYTLLDIIADYRRKCNIELLLRYMENGNNFTDGRSYPRHMYYQELSKLVDNEGNPIPEDQLNNISISVVTPGLPREFDELSIQMVKDGCIDKLGCPSFRHITYSFIYELGVYPTPEESKALIEKDETGKKRNKIDVLKERLFIRKEQPIKIKQTGLNCYELDTILKLKQISKFSPKKYSSLSNDELLILRNKLLFRLEQKIKNETEIWKTKLDQIDKVCQARDISLD